MANEIIQASLANEEFIQRATAGFDAYKEAVSRYPLERAERDTGVPAALIKRLAHEYAKADRAQICWTLGITEHHNAADNVLALINLGLLTGHVGRYGSGLVPLRGQNNVQGGGDMGAIPNKLTGFQDIENDADARKRFGDVYGVTIPPVKGMHLSQMFEAMERKELTAAYVVGENPLRSEADTHRTRELLEGLDHLVVQDMFLTDTAEVADVVLPGTASWCEAEGTVTNSERRVQRVRKALEPPPGARDDIEIISELARRLGTDWGSPSPEELWNELRTLSPMHRGMSYAKLDKLGGVQWPCPDEESTGTLFLHARLWEEDPAKRGAPAPFHVVEQEDPVDELTPEFPIRLTTGRRLESYNTGGQTSGYSTPLRAPETLNLSPEDARTLGFTEGEIAKVSSRRGSLTAPVHVDHTLREGLAFMTLHFPDQVETNILTLDAWDPKSGTAEFKATAIRVDKPDAGQQAPASQAASTAEVVS
jgi:formate dehydrogenase major subunit